MLGFKSLGKDSPLIHILLILALGLDKLDTLKRIINKKVKAPAASVRLTKAARRLCLQASELSCTLGKLVDREIEPCITTDYVPVAAVEKESSKEAVSRARECIARLPTSRPATKLVQAAFAQLDDWMANSSTKLVAKCRDAFLDEVCGAHKLQYNAVLREFITAIATLLGKPMMDVCNLTEETLKTAKRPLLKSTLESLGFTSLDPQKSPLADTLVMIAVGRKKLGTLIDVILKLIKAT